MLRYDNDAPDINTGVTKPILRLESREDFDSIPELLRAEICKQLGVEWDINHFDIRVISEDEKYAGHYIRRVNAVNAGVRFLLDSLMTDENREDLEKLKISLDTISKSCCDHLEQLDNNDISHYQNSLVHYSKVITTMLAVTLSIDPDLLVKQLDRAEQFATANKTRPVICTISRRMGLLNAHNYFVQVDQPENPFTTDTIVQLHNIKHQQQPLPKWYECLSDSDKNLMRHFLSTHDAGDFGNTVNTLSSKLRIIPTPANYGKHTLITLLTSSSNEQPQLTVHVPEFRSSHVASRDISSKHKDVRLTHAYQNLKKEIEDAIAVATERHKLEAGEGIANQNKNIVIPILYQTLITPLKEPDSSLDKDRLAAASAIIEELNEFNGRTLRQGEPNLSFALITSNHALNYGKYALPTTSWSTADSSTAESIDLLLYLMKAKYPDPHDYRHELLATLESNTMKLWSIESYRELYLSSLEQFVISECGGISIGSCVSGKDRKAVEIAHTDALKIFFNLYKTIPPLVAENEKDRADMAAFAEIFAEIYCTKHQMAIADLNAPGSFGIKTPAMYLPNHLQEAIALWYAAQSSYNAAAYSATQGKNLLKESDIMASNNEVKHFKPRSLSADTPDLSWKSRTLYFVQEDSIPLIINLSKTAAKFYLDTRKERLGWLARSYGSEAGKSRAQLCIQLMIDKDISDFHKILFVQTLINSGLGENLISDMVKAMRFLSIEAATHTLSDYIALAASHHGINDPAPINNCAEVIRQSLSALSKPGQVQASVDVIKQEFDNLDKLAQRRGSSPKL